MIQAFDDLPILGWRGPSKEMITDKVMAGMAEAGFTVSHSDPGDDPGDVRRALDIAHANGMKLLVQHPLWNVKDDFVFDENRKSQIREQLGKIKDHPGLYGYFLRDEPKIELLPLLAEVHAFVRSLDPVHLVYINHYGPAKHWGKFTGEHFWRNYIEITRPQILSYDAYPIGVACADDLKLSNIEQPNAFPEEKLILSSNYFESLETLRMLSLCHNIPLWAFTLSERHWCFPTPTEGHLRFQLMNNLAYGAKGLQYFTYCYGLVDRKGDTTETWALARRVNREIRAMAPVFQTLRNIGVWRTGPLWSGAKKLYPTGKAEAVSCEGDPVTIGFFLDPDETRYLFVVNGNPCSWAKIWLKINLEDTKLYEFKPEAAQFWTLEPVCPATNQRMILSPGEGRLIRIGKSEKPK